jgi:hypothetical protein
VSVLDEAGIAVPRLTWGTTGPLRFAERERQRQRREEDAAVRRAMEAHVLAHPNLPEEPAGATSYVTIPVPKWGSTAVMLRDLIAVRADLRDRLRDLM